MTNISKIVIALCEGPHDTAFLYRVLRSDCYRLFSEKIDKLPNIVTQFIKQGYHKIDDLEKLKLDALKNYNIPNKILYKNNTLILLYAMGGDKDKLNNSQRLALINKYLTTDIPIGEDSKEYNPSDEKDGFSKKRLEYSFLFFYDADKDANKQIQKINNYLKELNIDEELKHNEYIKSQNTNYGCFIFSKDGAKGSLEDIMFEIISKQQSNKQLITDAELYLNNNITENRYQSRMSIQYNENNSCKEILKKKKAAKIYQNKSLLGIMGQLQNSGASNVVTIEHSDYITLSNKTQSVLDIIEFFNKA